ncbi:MAG: carbohydrate kinase family protein [Candidatus Aenigmarchaeota archaeon]|nr:carbohydrate kinase family protein [Candidatus Aenigmarchaeota archaeon]
MEAVAVGSAFVDMFIYAKAKKIKNGGRTYLAYPAGGKMLAEKIEFHAGGGGANVAAGLSKMGIKTSFLGILGDDYGKNIIWHSLLDHKVKFAGAVKHGACGYSIILDGDGIDRSIIGSRGMNDSLSVRNSKPALKARWLCFSSMLGESLKTQKKLAEAAKKKGIKIAYNPSLYMIGKGILEIVKNCHVLSLNKEEAEALSRIKNDRERIIKKIHGMGPEIVCMTDGAKPSYCYDGKLYKIQPKHTRTTERTGAGDAFFSGFVASLIRNKSIEQALKIGTANAQSTIRKIGAQNGLLTMRQAIRKGKSYRVTVL